MKIEKNTQQNSLDSGQQAVQDELSLMGKGKSLQ